MFSVLLRICLCVQREFISFGWIANKLRSNGSHNSFVVMKEKKKKRKSCYIFFFLFLIPFFFVLIEIEERDSAQVFQIHTYITSASKKHDPRHFFLRMSMDLYFQKHKHDVLTHLRNFSHWGRPKWQKVLAQVRKTHDRVPIGVFCCGPPALAKELSTVCAQQTSSVHGAFVFYKEQFGL